MDRCVVLGVCRGPAKGHIAVAYDGELGAIVSVRRGKKLLPSSIIRFADYSIAGHATVFDVCVPLLSSGIEVKLLDAASKRVLGVVQLSDTVFRVKSRLLSHRNPALASCLRAHESSDFDPCQLMGVYPVGDGNNAWRFKCRFAGAAADAALSLRGWSDSGDSLELAPIVLEDHVVPTAHDAASFERVMAVSIPLDESIGNACFEFSLSDGSDPLLGCGYTGWVRDSVGHWNWLACGGGASRGYESWAVKHRVTPSALKKQSEGAAPNAEVAGESVLPSPLISLITCVFNPPVDYLEQCVNSVLAQSYSNWEYIIVNVGDRSGSCADYLDSITDSRVCVYAIENADIASNTNFAIDQAKGDYVAFLDHDDVLEPDALYRYVAALKDNQDIDLFYSDEDHLKDGVLVGPAFKPDADLTKLRSYNYVTHFLMVSRYALDHTERSPSDVAGAQDYDLTLKCFEVARSIHHEPRVLYHWREHEGSTAGGSNQKPYAHLAGKRALERHLGRVGEEARVVDGPLPYTYVVDYRLPSPLPMVSIVIPSKDHADLLWDCVSSIFERSTYENLEVVIVENNSQESQTFELYERLEAEYRVLVVTWTEAQLGPDAPKNAEFNYSSLINFGVSYARGEYCVLLNNDTKVIEPAWVEHMLGQVMRPGVGVVGAKLLFEDGLVQHAGVIANGNQDFAHINRDLPGNAMGYNHSLALAQEYSMVTGACQMASRHLFEELGGYDEQLAVGFNDGDFCLRAREAGYRVVFEPRAVLHHREFSSRGRESIDARLASRLLHEKSIMLSKHAAYFGSNDPFVNRNIGRFSDWWELGE